MYLIYYLPPLSAVAGKEYPDRHYVQQKGISVIAMLMVIQMTIKGDYVPEVFVVAITMVMLTLTVMAIVVLVAVTRGSRGDGEAGVFVIMVVMMMMMMAVSCRGLLPFVCKFLFVSSSRTGLSSTRTCLFVIADTVVCMATTGRNCMRNSGAMMQPCSSLDACSFAFLSAVGFGCFT